MPDVIRIPGLGSLWPSAGYPGQYRAYPEGSPTPIYRDGIGRPGALSRFPNYEAAVEALKEARLVRAS